MKGLITKAAFAAIAMFPAIVAMAQDADAPFPPAPSGSPVGTPLGLGLLVIGAAAAGAYALRRK